MFMMLIDTGRIFYQQGLQIAEGNGNLAHIPKHKEDWVICSRTELGTLWENTSVKVQ
jgi:hypothetical protein